MSSPLERYKSLVDKLHNLPVGSTEKDQVNAELLDAWNILCEKDRLEAEGYWHTTTGAFNRPN